MVLGKTFHTIPERFPCRVRLDTHRMRMLRHLGESDHIDRDNGQDYSMKPTEMYLRVQQRV